MQSMELHFEITLGGLTVVLRAWGKFLRIAQSVEAAKTQAACANT